MAEFQAFPKIPRLNRDITITEKIDGTNAAVVIEPIGTPLDVKGMAEEPDVVIREDIAYLVSAQSRKRMITPGKQTDNYGFAGWVRKNKEELVTLLGWGRHFGEWWGSGIARNYGLVGQRNFSLFRPRPNWSPVCLSPPDGMTRDSVVDIVPVLYEGPFLKRNEVNGELPHEEALWGLRHTGSEAVPGFMNPEGIMIYHTAAGIILKVTCEDDDKPKEVAAREAAKVAANGGGKVVLD